MAAVGSWRGSEKVAGREGERQVRVRGCGRVPLQKCLRGDICKNNNIIDFFLLRVELNFNMRTYVKNI